MPTITDLHGLFLHTLRDIYYAEQQAQKIMPTLAETATSDALTALLQGHVDQSEARIDRLEQVFEMIGETAEGVRCEAMDGIVKEARHLLGDIEDPATRDAAIVASAQAIDHYEITRYGSLTTWAEELGHPDAANLLGESLADEEESDDALTELAEDRLNQRAV